LVKTFPCGYTQKTIECNVFGWYGFNGYTRILSFVSISKLLYDDYQIFLRKLFKWPCNNSLRVSTVYQLSHHLRSPEIFYDELYLTHALLVEVP